MAQQVNSDNLVEMNSADRQGNSCSHCLVGTARSTFIGDDSSYMSPPRLRPTAGASSPLSEPSVLRSLP